MNDREKTISSLLKKGLLDESSVGKLRDMLKHKLKAEAKLHEQEIVQLRSELDVLQSQMAG